MTLFGTLISLHGWEGMHLGTSDFGFSQPSDPQMELVSFRRLSRLLHTGTRASRRRAEMLQGLPIRLQPNAPLAISQRLGNFHTH